ncbi:MAG: DUF4402 domain-containing protein [Gammaproteobacteria bacterium]|nr:DUF4402 domain-containing protein [Gammaproteobacteria bacterium]
MNKTNLVLNMGLAALAASMYSSAASAATANGTAQATLVTAVTVAESRGLNFGSFILDPLGDTVTLSNAAATVRGAGAGTTLLGASEASGEFQITGTPGATVSISTTIAPAPLSNGTDLLLFTPSATDIATLTLTGVPANDVFYVGGQVVGAAGITTGVYTNVTAYVVNVNYQ